MKYFIPIIVLLSFPFSGFSQITNLDTLFGMDGISMTRVGDSLINTQESFLDIFIQPDGKLVSIGHAYYPYPSSLGGPFKHGATTCKYLEDGSLDEEFGTGGKSHFMESDGPYPIWNLGGTGGLLQPDNRILLVGGLYWQQAGWDEGYWTSLARVNPDGSLDSSFVTGIFTAQSNTPALAIQSDNKILLFGSKHQTVHMPNEPNSSVNNLNVLRIEDDGKIDSLFGLNGNAMIVDFTSNIVIPGDIALQSDGRIVVYGTLQEDIGRFALVARLNTNGTLDNSFGINGITLVPLEGIAIPTSMKIQPDAKLLLCGFSDEGVGFIIRLHPDGSLDSSFGNNGRVIVSGGNKKIVLNDIELQNDGKILAAGSIGNDNTDFLLARFSHTGEKEVEAINDFGSEKEGWEALKIQSDGKIVAAGNIRVSQYMDFCAIARYIPDLIVGTFEAENNPTISTLIYPNPVSDFVILEYSLESETEIYISLFDRNGNLVKSYFDKSKRPAGLQKEILQLEDYFPSGSYFLKIIAGKNIKSVWLSIL